MQENAISLFLVHESAKFNRSTKSHNPNGPHEPIISFLSATSQKSYAVDHTFSLLTALSPQLNHNYLRKPPAHC
jgi:hypothetical protein